MKKIFLLLSLSTLFMYSCQDVNDDFDWLDGLTDPQNVKAYEYTIAEADYATIASAAKGTENEESAKLLQTAKIFSDVAPADKLVPYLLAKKYFTADVGSSAKITYQYQANKDEVSGGLTNTKENPFYRLDKSDYKLAWGTPYATALSPAKAPEDQLPVLLENKFEQNESLPAGTYKAIEYDYSEEEPIDTDQRNMYSQIFDDLGLNANADVAVNGWLNVDLAGTRTWQIKEYKGNFYAQASSNGSKEKNENWLILPVDLEEAKDPFLAFDVTAGYYNAPCLTIKVSADFDSKKDNIKTATWSDITEEFELPTEPAKGYGTLSPAGKGDLNLYKGKQIYIAFVYEGDDTSDPKATTTFQIDNIEIIDNTPWKEVAEKNVKYAAYYKKSEAEGDWAPAGEDVIVLQTEDYKFLGLDENIIGQDQTDLIAVYLSEKFATTTSGEKVVLYKNAINSFNAEKVICLGYRQWEVQNFIETKTEQFMLSTIGWVFDPTFVVTMVKGKGETDDYMLVVQEVIDTKLESTPTIVNSYKDTEYYYGFNANYGNITYRDKDRVYDPSYPASASEDEKRAFCEQRTLEGFAIYLRKKFPDAAAEVNGVEQKARITTTLYYGPASSDTEAFTYEFQCLGNNEWKYLQRTSLATGKVEKAKE